MNKTKTWLLALICLIFTNLQAQDFIYEIQLATHAGPDYQKFKSLESIGYVYALEMENSLSRICLGAFTQKNVAEKKLELVKKKGFKEAFLFKKEIKADDAVYVVQLTTYDLEDDIYWPDWQRIVSNLVVQLGDDKVRVAAGPFLTQAEAQATMDRLQGKAPKDIFIKKVSTQFIHKVTSFDLQRSKSYGQSAGLSRNSVQALQELLASDGYYSGKADGMLNPATQAAIDKYKTSNERYLRHQKLAKDAPSPYTIEKFSLQYYINLIPTDAATSAKGLEQFKNPIAKAYLAYLYLNGDVRIADKNTVVNDLMNNALKQVFKDYKGPTRYDFSMKYSYEDIGQLIRHLKAIYEVLKDRPDMPCWLFNRHPSITKDVFQPYWNSTRDNYMVSNDCGSFIELEEMRVLLLVSKEFAATEKTIESINSINRLFIVPQYIAHQEMESLEKWNGNLWRNLKTWAAGSPLQQNMYNLLRFSYYDALQKLEMHFMKKGIPGLEARSLGLKILKESVGCNLDEYCN